MQRLCGKSVETGETFDWVASLKCGRIPIWSRLETRNGNCIKRRHPNAKYKSYCIEIKGCLYSIWGNLHPDAAIFDRTTRGRQYLACNVLALCAAMLYPLDDWNANLLDAIIVNGDRYQFQSLNRARAKNFEFCLEHLNKMCSFESIKMKLHFEHVAFGILYAKPTPMRWNLCTALKYFFSRFTFGILQVKRRSLAFGVSQASSYFMFDCQSREYPLFKANQGAAYLLQTPHFPILLMCIIYTLRIEKLDVEFNLHSVDIQIKSVPSVDVTSLAQHATRAENGEGYGKSI